MDALLAIEPEFAHKILSGKKRYEFRKTTFGDAEEVDVVYLYASSPERMIVGGFVSSRIVPATPTELWELFGDESGIESVDRFMEYFDGADVGYAIEIDDVYEFDEYVDPRAVFKNFSPPMSFHYLNTESEQVLRHRLADSVSKPEEIPLPQFIDDSMERSSTSD